MNFLYSTFICEGSWTGYEIQSNTSFPLALKMGGEALERLAKVTNIFAPVNCIRKFKCNPCLTYYHYQSKDLLQPKPVFGGATHLSLMSCVSRWKRSSASLVVVICCSSSSCLVCSSSRSSWALCKSGTKVNHRRDENTASSSH